MTKRNEILTAMCIVALAVAGFGVARAADEPADAREPAAQKTTTAPSEDTLKDEDVVEMPKVLNMVKPKYPDTARKRGQQGTVLVRALVKKDGTTSQVRVPTGKGVAPDLDRAAVEAIRQWTFTPGTKKGKPVDVYIMIPVKFALDAEKEKK